VHGWPVSLSEPRQAGPIMKANNDIYVVLISDKYVFVDLFSAVFEELVNVSFYFRRC
jgi:hypothetical protein